MAWHSVLSDPTLTDFVALERGELRALVRRGHEEEGALLGGQLPSDRETVVGGRAAHPIVQLSGGDRAVVRAYRRGGMVRHLNRERYFLGHRSFEELRITERARARGVQVPEVLAAVERRGPVGYTASIATRWITGGVDLAAWLSRESGGNTETVLREVGGQIARMHAAGIDHPDLNLRNVLVVSASDSDTGVFLLDFDRAHLEAHPLAVPSRARNIRRFLRSARKLRIEIGAPELRALEAGYGPSWPK